ncbi:hypothetical protein ABGB12_32210 [Actinocorallia sp. B10E7]|uniref:hypothetical protein n=1 Tax=Actinocorallia sp. B10E7 TaxID=3153558 RepID=UPI00325E909F
MTDEADYHDEIRLVQEDAKRLWEALQAETFPDHPAVQDLRKRVEQQVKHLRRAAGEPITLGVVGEYSVGKSLLLGTLLGCPDLLPVESRATTGNVTALYLRAGTPGEPTRIDGSAEISYLTEQELSACVRDIIQVLLLRYEELPGRDGSEMRDYDPVTEGWDRFVTWARKLWDGDRHIPKISKVVMELLEIRRAHKSAEDLLGTSVSIGEKTVRQALDLGTDRELPEEFPELPVRPGVDRDQVRSDLSALRATFPLIRRVAYRVLVDPRVWSLERLTGGNEVVLLDFPGLSATRSSQRDAFLSRSELRSVHTIVTVFSMRRPGTDIPHEFYSMLAQYGRDETELRRSILAVGNIFDAVHLPSGITESLTFEQLIAGSHDLTSFMGNAGDLVGRQERRMTLVSAVRGIDVYGMPVDGITGEEKERLTEAVPESRKSAEGWEPIAGLVEPGHWKDVLTEFVKDGGVRALRRLIEDHAAEHGLVNKVEGVRRERAILERMLPQLERSLGDNRPPSERQAGYEVVKSLFDDFRAACQPVSRAARELRDPTVILLADGRPLLDWIRDQALVAVSEWSQWQAIMQRAENGFIRKSHPPEMDEEGEGMGGWWDDDDDDDGDLFVGSHAEETTDAFYEPFADSYIVAVRESRRMISESIASWVSRHDPSLEPLRYRLQDPELREHLEQGTARLRTVDRSSRVRMRRLEAMADLEIFVGLDPDRPEPELLTRAAPDRIPDDAEIAAAFPLYRGSAMPWHSQAPEHADAEFARHQLYVLRLRRQLAFGLADAVTRRAIADLESVHKRLQRMLETAFREILPNQSQVRRMFFDDQDFDMGELEGEDSGEGGPLRSLLDEWRKRDAA